MAYLARPDAVQRRLDPRNALPGCRTLLVVSLLYGGQPTTSRGDVHRPEPRARRNPRRLPVVARYALGRDYHHVFEEKLADLALEMGRLAPNLRTKLYVDYGPVLERDHAQRAGLGWIGKNTMLINPTLGSWLMLGVLLLDEELEPDPPFLPDRCGTCRRCIDACPTDAIVDGRVLDARLCISYLTIELKGSIPTELRSGIGNRVFGCDICQEVCPWNDDAPVPEHSPFSAHGQPLPPDDMVTWTEELIDLDDDAFRSLYRGTAFYRPGRSGMLRNLAVGLGNYGEPEVRPTLLRLANDHSPLVREHAQWALSALADR